MKKSISVQTDRYKFDMQICKGQCVPNVGESYLIIHMFLNLFKLSNNCNVHTIFRVIKLSSKQGRNNSKNI